ncbi:acyltransferase [Rhodoferax sp. AJA081-3]|uniref:acyltransferase n=1 Tax=Rhodoferax sp. AJA081-3 TaxID=2752316 RepID=UPI001AE04376|nr:acyltransferase [Rhodoferax sp. AJA081-3]QTN29211.1 acyltransferase [Rhodoferax sp. AJA081-3]
MTTTVDKNPHWAEIGESTFVAGIWLLYWIHRVLGRWPFRICIYPVVAVHWWTRPLVRKSSQQYFERLQAHTGALGHSPNWRDGIRHLALFAETMLDKLVAASGRYPVDRVKSTGREAVYATAQSGRGGLIVTAHMGCLELCRNIEQSQGLLRLNVLVHTRHAEQFNRVLKRLNPCNDLKLIEVTEVGPATAVLLAEKVAAGEFIAIAGDRIPVFASKTVDAMFLGHSAPLPVGPYVLAHLLQCPVYMLGCIHEGLGYRLHFKQLAERVQLPRRERDVALASYAQHYADTLTDLLVQSPYDWFNFFPFWDQAANPTHASIQS